MNLSVKALCIGLLVLATGVPILQEWESLWLAVTVLAVVFGVRQPGSWRIAAAVAVVLVAVLLKAALPRADIAEGHNTFLVIRDGEALERSLPPDIFRSWKTQFDALYPPDPEPFEPRSSWRAHGSPKALFAQSADAVWRPSKYTRQVDRIAFTSLGDFRGGFANDHQFPWWDGELRRETMPFFVMYELTSASVGSSLSWKGQVFWERQDGSFEELVHRDVASRQIVAGDAGKRVFAAFFSTPGMLLMREGELWFRLEPSVGLRIARYAEDLLTIVAGFAVVALIVVPRWGSYARAVAFFAAGYGVLTAFMWVSLGKYLGMAYPPHGGGDDGLVHDGWGHEMAILAGRGELVEALKGDELVYWFTPGFRYFRMIEKLIFGDTNLLYALFLACIPIAVFYLIRHFLGVRWAAVITAISLLIPVGNLSFVQYLANAKLGYGEALAIGMFLVGLVLLLRTQPAWGGASSDRASIWIAGIALAGAMFIRPNFSLAVAWLGAAHAWASWRRRDAGAIVALALGLGLALWMPFHNVFYGDEFYLISRSGATISVSFGPRDYVAALVDVLQGDFSTREVQVTSSQLRGWLWTQRFVLVGQLLTAALAAQVLNLIALAITCWVAVRWLVSRFRDTTGLAIVAVASLLAHLPMLFIFATHYRFSMLGWDLALVVAAVWMLSRFSRRPMPSTNFSHV